MRSPLIVSSLVGAALAVVGCSINIEPCGCPGAGGAGVTVGVTVTASASTSGAGGQGGASASSTTTGAGGFGGSTASSSSGGPSCPTCSAGIAGDNLSDRLCPVSMPLFDALLACACTEGGACASVCLIPEMVPGDGATCPLTSAGGASSACTDCLAASPGCATSFDACIADMGS